jgi:glycosyltransferase involved in cell wall biosynthesis
VKKVCYIISDVNKALAFEWVAAHFKDKVRLLFILIGNSGTSMEKFLIGNSIETYVIENKKHKSLLQKFIAVAKILQTEKPEIVHCHLWTAVLVGLSSAWLLKIKKRVFTRHHAMIHYKEFPSGRKWDRLCNFLATDIIAISERMKNILIERDKALRSKVKIINHGFDLDFFQRVDAKRVSDLKMKYNIPSDKIIIGGIARYIKLKGVPFIINAFKLLHNDRSDVHLVLANARGPFADEIQTCLKELPAQSYTEIEFEDDLSALYKTFNVYVHTPINEDAESFGQTFVEALASGVPSVFTLAGVAREFIVHKTNALVVDYCDSQQIYEAIQLLLNDESLAQTLIGNGKQSVQKFSLQKMLFKLEELYG